VEPPVSLLQMLENGLFALGQVLRFPVMALLWVCVAAALFMAGSCLVELVTRRRERSGFDVGVWLKAGPVLAAADARLMRLPPVLRGLVSDVQQERAEGPLAPGALEHLVLQREERVRRTVNPSRMLVKVGPSLGLLGTLIPMGSALAALAAGNLEAMAGQMIVAFTTTIVGLATGTLAFVVATVRNGWTTETIRDQRYLAEQIAVELARPAA
jgi:biopolymer transport protein ExbB/TolQ